jgi:ABC-2 type transport system permease protein
MGGVAYELLRPVDLYNYWFARAIAFRTARTSLRALPLLLVSIFVLPRVGLERWALPLPADLATSAAFLLSLFGMVLMSTAVTMLLNVALLYTRSHQVPNYLAGPAVVLLSGMIVPLPLFPDSMRMLLALQPLRGLGDVPFRIYSGHIPALGAWDDILQQLAWSALFIYAGRALLARALRTAVVQGG